MAVGEQPRAEASGLIYAFDYSRGEMNLLPDTGVATQAAAKTKLAGAIVLGLVIGAVAGILVGGLMGIHETSSGSIQVAGTSVSHPTTP
jgi:ABC-type nitrate/sulfonate/bicarbonate transport system permease component